MRLSVRQPPLNRNINILFHEQLHNPYTSLRQCCPSSRVPFRFITKFQGAYPVFQQEERTLHERVAAVRCLPHVAALSSAMVLWESQPTCLSRLESCRGITPLSRAVRAFRAESPAFKHSSRRNLIHISLQSHSLSAHYCNQDLHYMQVQHCLRKCLNSLHTRTLTL